MKYMKISYNKNMKKLIVSILLVSALTVGCSRINNKNSFTSDDVSLKNKEETLSQGVNEENKIQQTNHEEIEKKAKKLHPIEIEEQECMKKVDYTTAGMNECSDKAMNAWFKEIDKYMNLLKEITSEEEYANILKAQTKWKDYQEAEFVAISIIMNKQGTIFQNILSGEECGLVKQRALDLRSFYETLAFD